MFTHRSNYSAQRNGAIILGIILLVLIAVAFFLIFGKDTPPAVATTPVVPASATPFYTATHAPTATVQPTATELVPTATRVVPSVTSRPTNTATPVATLQPEPTQRPKITLDVKDFSDRDSCDCSCNNCLVFSVGRGCKCYRIIP